MAKSYAVAQRTCVRSDGVGADRGDLCSHYETGRAADHLALGAGLLLALGLGRVLAQMLYQVSPSDPVALIAASVMLGSAALLACFLPARRAMRVTPMTALRTE